MIWSIFKRDILNKTFYLWSKAQTKLKRLICWLLYLLTDRNLEKVHDVHDGCVSQDYYVGFVKRENIRFEKTFVRLVLEDKEKKKNIQITFLNRSLSLIWENYCFIANEHHRLYYLDENTYHVIHNNTMSFFYKNDILGD